jgi:hypothetical protein
MEEKTPHDTVEKIIDSVRIPLIEPTLPFDLTILTDRCC